MRERGALEQQAVTKALAEARRRAEQAAAQAHVTLRGVKSLSLDCSSWPIETVSPLLPAGPLSVAPTDVKLEVTAKVTYRYE